MPARHIVAIGGSDAGISAALRIRELDPSTDVTVVVADAYPNFSICGIPYYVSGKSRTGPTSLTAPPTTWPPPACGSSPTPAPPESTSPNTPSTSSTPPGHPPNCPMTP